jgi:hypothetical protein
MATVVFNKRFQVIRTTDNPSARGRITVALKEGHIISIQHGVINGNLLSWLDDAAGDNIQSIEPCIRIARMVQRLPLGAIFFPYDIYIISEGISVTKE